MLETIREYGTELLAERSETAEVAQRHTAYYLALAEEAGPALTGPGALTWLARLDTEHDNLRAALRWAREQDDGAAVLRLAAALWPFWEQRGHLSEGRWWLSEGWSVPPWSPRPCGSTGWSARRGWRWTRRYSTRRRSTARRRWRWPASSASRTCWRPRSTPRACCPRARPVRRLGARPPGRAGAGAGGHRPGRRGGGATRPGLRGDVRGRRPRASALAEESLAAARGSGDRYTLAQVLYLLGWAAGNAVASERAVAFGAEALGLFRALGDTGGQADVLFMLGTFGVNTGDYQRAAHFFAGSLALLRERSDEKSTARGLGGLGTVLLNLGDRAAARETLEDSLAVARKYGDRWSTAMSLILVGHVDLADGDHTRAQALLAEAASLFADTGNLMYLQWCRGGPGRGSGGTRRLRACRGTRRGARRPACPDWRAAAARPPGRVRADAGRHPRHPYPSGFRRGPCQAIRPDAASDHHGSHKQQELAPDVSPLAIAPELADLRAAARRHEHDSRRADSAFPSRRSRSASSSVMDDSYRAWRDGGAGTLRCKC